MIVDQNPKLFNSYKTFEGVGDACALIHSTTAKWASFWPKSHGWAPTPAADLMKQELMDRQLEMARSLTKWPARLLSDDSPGELVQAWTNLGSVIEGALKVFMCVYYVDWLNDDAAPTKKGEKKTPDGGKLGAMFEEMIQFAEKKGFFKKDEIDFIRLVQRQRNLIHPLKSGVVEGREAFEAALLHTAALHDDVERRLPYPDGYS